MVNNFTVAPVIQPKVRNEIDSANTDQLKPMLTEEKVEVLIKEVVRIKPGDFSAFKHAFEEFIISWGGK